MNEFCLLHSRSLRLCIASVRFLSSSVNISLTYISDMTWPILTRLGHKYQLTIPFMSYDQIWVKGHVGVKKVISPKTLLLQITGYDFHTWGVTFKSKALATKWIFQNYSQLLDICTRLVLKPPRNQFCQGFQTTQKAIFNTIGWGIQKSVILSWIIMKTNGTLVYDKRSLVSIALHNNFSDKYPKNYKGTLKFVEEPIWTFQNKTVINTI